MQVTIQIPVSRKIAETTFKTDVRFKTKARATKRTVAISDAFGIGVDDEHEFVIYDNFVVEINKGDIVYITGESGSGKSLLLKELASKISENSHEFGKIITGKEVERSIIAEKPIIEQVGNDVAEAIRILSMAGLNEAFLMLRKYNELSDGQKYRFKLAKLIDSGADTWTMDEFLSLLDRTTAIVVAYTMQKAARKLGKTVIVATAHADLEDLYANVRVLKHFGSNVDVSYRKIDANKPCSLLKRIRIENGSIKDYNVLKQFHYRDSRIMHKMIYRAVLHDELVGVIVYGPPHLALRARNITLPQYRKQKDESWHENAQRINKDFIRIWRIVIHPKYRGIGIATMLVKKSMPLTNFPCVETLAVMAKYSNFFDEAGMTRIDPSHYLNYDNRYISALKRLAALGFDLELLGSKNYNLKVLEGLSAYDLGEVRQIVSTYFIAEKFRKPMRKEYFDHLEAIAKALTARRLPYVYLIWKNLGFHN